MENLNRSKGYFPRAVHLLSRDAMGKNEGWRNSLRRLFIPVLITIPNKDPGESLIYFYY